MDKGFFDERCKNCQNSTIKHTTILLIEKILLSQSISLSYRARRKLVDELLDMNEIKTCDEPYWQGLVLAKHCIGEKRPFYAGMYKHLKTQENENVELVETKG